MKKAINCFIDSTFFRPTLYMQTIIVIYLDIITGYKIPRIYALLSNKNREIYDALLEYISQLINSEEVSYIKTITLDYEDALLQSVTKFFPNHKKIGYHYHYKQALYRKAQQYKLTGKKDKEQTLKLINKYLGILPFANIENENSFEKYHKGIENKYGDKYKDYLKYFYLNTKF